MFQSNSWWKSALFGSALALASQTALANKPLPCPTDSPLVDTVWLVQWATKQKVENRLRALDSQKHHQVVVVTVNSLEEYGYGSIEEMANAVGMGCKIGYRWENTGVVVLYTKTPALYRIENAETERYITDDRSNQIREHSKTPGVCEKSDVACRLDDITAGIDTIIRKQFPDQQAVQPLKTATAESDRQKAEKETSELLNAFWLGAVILVVLWGGAAGWNALLKRSRRKAVKRQIFELGIRLKTEKAKYPEWLLNRYARKADRAMNELENFSDEQLDDIIGLWRWKTIFDRNVSIVIDTFSQLEVGFKEITEKVRIKTAEVTEQIAAVLQMQESLKKEGFKFQTVEIPTVSEWSNPDETLSQLEQALDILEQSKNKLIAIPELYRSVKELDIRLQNEFASKKNEFAKTAGEYAEIYWTAKSTDHLSGIENQIVDKFVRDFQSVFQEKNIERLGSLSRKAEVLLSPVQNEIDSMKVQIRWYNEIPSKIASRRKQIDMQAKREYGENARNYAQKTGEKAFVGYDMQAALLMLKNILASVTGFHFQKRNLGEIDKKLQEFDTEYGKLKEYIWLGAALAAIVAAEIAEETARQERQRREEERRRQDEEDRRRRQQEEDDDRSRKQRDDDSSSSSSSSGSSSWSDGGGSGFSGGGSTGD